MTDIFDIKMNGVAVQFESADKSQKITLDGREVLDEVSNDFIVGAGHPMYYFSEMTEGEKAEAVKKTVTMELESTRASLQDQVADEGYSPEERTHFQADLDAINKALSA